MQIFDVIIFFELRTIQKKTVKPTYLCPLGARKLARFVLFRLIKKRSFNLLCVLDQTTVNKKAPIHYVIPINDMVHGPL